jgi:hypothetical protein
MSKLATVIFKVLLIKSKLIYILYKTMPNFVVEWIAILLRIPEGAGFTSLSARRLDIVTEFFLVLISPSRQMLE